MPLAIALAIAAGTTAGARQQKATPWVVPWLTEYASGAQSAVAKRLTQIGDAAQLERDLEAVVTPWTTGKNINPDERRRAIAAFALEAAYVRLDLLFDVKPEFVVQVGTDSAPPSDSPKEGNEAREHA